MSDPYLGEIKALSFNFAPKGWAQCLGQLLPINQNQALFAILGVTYGGDGVTTFALPNLGGRVPICFGPGNGLPPVNVGDNGGEATHQLTINEMPPHFHRLSADSATAATSNAYQPTNGASLGQSIKHASRGANAELDVYSTDMSNLVPLASAAISSVGSSQPHENRQPYLALTMCIALTGIFPTRG